MELDHYITLKSISSSQITFGSDHPYLVQLDLDSLITLCMYGLQGQICHEL